MCCSSVRVQIVRMPSNLHERKLFSVEHMNFVLISESYTFFQPFTRSKSGQQSLAELKQFLSLLRNSEKIRRNSYLSLDFKSLLREAIAVYIASNLCYNVSYRLINFRFNFKPLMSSQKAIDIMAENSMKRKVVSTEEPERQDSESHSLH